MSTDGSQYPDPYGSTPPSGSTPSTPDSTAPQYGSGYGSQYPGAPVPPAGDYGSTPSGYSAPAYGAPQYDGTQPPYSPAPGQPGYPAPGPQTPTDGVSIAALVTGVLGTGPIALVLGILGLSRTKGGQRKGRGFALAGAILGGLGILAWVGVVLFVVLAANAATSHLNGLRDDCAAGDYAACDDLYYDAPLGSDNEDFGSTCGQQADEEFYGHCEDYFDPNAPAAVEDPEDYGDDPDLDALWDSCAEGDMGACDDLYWEAPLGSSYENFGDTCGNREDGNSYCED